MFDSQSDFQKLNVFFLNCINIKICIMTSKILLNTAEVHLRMIWLLVLCFVSIVIILNSMVIIFSAELFDDF